jgi:hypothetical protein
MDLEFPGKRPGRKSEGRGLDRLKKVRQTLLVDLCATLSRGAGQVYRLPSDVDVRTPSPEPEIESPTFVEDIVNPELSTLHDHPTSPTILENRLDLENDIEAESRSVTETLGMLYNSRDKMSELRHTRALEQLTSNTPTAARLFIWTAASPVIFNIRWRLESCE